MSSISINDMHNRHYTMLCSVKYLLISLNSARYHRTPDASHTTRYSDLAPHVISRGNGCKQNGYCVVATCCRHYMRTYEGSRVVATFQPAVPPSLLSAGPV